MITKYSKTFLKESKILRKKYPKFDLDLLNFINNLEKESLLNSSKIKELKSLEIYKSRIRNSSNQLGKSGGFRIIYYIKTNEKTFYLLNIYSKTEKTNISTKEILQILKSENLI